MKEAQEEGGYQKAKLKKEQKDKWFPAVAKHAKQEPVLSNRSESQ